MVDGSPMNLVVAIGGGGSSTSCWFLLGPVLLFLVLLVGFGLLSSEPTNLLIKPKKNPIPIDCSADDHQLRFLRLTLAVERRIQPQ